ncbi:serine/threonine-protein kinase [Planomonospora corallina]|uniref:Serine/threonine-protein kinase n=1 Tax=Planomonospora corallina TaxID=1806052 RepID=A0ABV8I5Z1_9ACTN
MDQSGVDRLRAADPERIGPYRLLGRLGEGGMGTVYLALAPTGRPVAVKVIKAEFAIEEGFAARFHAEVDNARRVASFCTAQVLDNGDFDDGRPYMVTEYIAGTPLSRQISRHGALEPGTLHGVALGVAAALAAIHVAGLVHRDLKPGNVILSLSGPRVIDFGIARALDSPSGFTRSGEVLGSPGWWAPEQVRGRGITPAADVFAWGCLIAYAGNGRHPYGRGDAITMASRLLNSRPDLGALPAPLNELVRLATAMDPQQRPTAQDLLIALVGGGIAAPSPRRADPPTLVATDVLAESWQAPPNVEPDATLTLGALHLEPPAAPQEPAAPARDPSASSTGPAPSRPGSAPGAGEEAPTGPGRPDRPERPRAPLWRWTLAGVAVAAALAVTGAVLANLGGEDVRATASPAPTGPVPGPDVGRGIPLGPAYGSALGAPHLVVPRAPDCGLADWPGTAPARGRFCAVRWILLNPGGEQVLLSGDPLVLVDDRGASHTPAPVSSSPPAALDPGERVDGVLVYDLPPGRGPARLTGRVAENGTEIEVRLS